ncbi:odorant receptor 94b [Monomorium pharaonis]|uniref:odorant receptor 94b n=1 Tax=Monomorium pharaonis TaxID=307658 RepID=UPI0017470C12|nr:odorant receptor 94b [Monomorium pharaonis]
MHVLQLTFKILTIVGCWRPKSCSSFYLRFMYDAYTVFMIILLYTFLVSQFLDIIWNVDNAEDFTENFYATLASVVSCSKMLSLLVNRKNINKLTNVFLERPYRPSETDEMKIRYKFDRHTYLTAGSLVNVACDSLICGLLAHICCQIEILECRLSKISNHDTLRDCCDIYRYALRLNNKFKMTIAMQFVVSTLVVCSNLYQMTKSTNINASYLPLLLYMSCMLTQIFIYCWYGNEVKLKSTQLLNNVFAMDWVTMNKNFKKSLIIIMNRAIVPIEFTSAYVLSMNLDSFVGVSKKINLQKKN